MGLFQKEYYCLCNTILSGNIFHCHSISTIRGNYFVGGLVGVNDTYGNITMSYSTSIVNGVVAIGGLCGLNRNTDSTNSMRYKSNIINAVIDTDWFLYSQYCQV